MTGTDIEAGEEQDKSPEKEESILYDLNAENFVALTSTGSHFIMFYAPWCGHCKRLEPTWLELAKLYQSSDAFPSNVNIGRVSAYCVNKENTKLLLKICNAYIPSITTVWNKVVTFFLCRFFFRSIFSREKK